MPFGATITSKSNARVKTLRAAFSGGGPKTGEMLGIEGENLLSEAVRSGIKLQTVFIREGSEDLLRRPSLAGLQAAEFVVLSVDVFTSAVDTRSPQGIAALLPVPVFAPADSPQGTVLVLEALQDPGNLGTILRSAEAFGVEKIFVTPETVNQWNPKVVRASAGSVFRVQVVRASLVSIVEMLQGSEHKLYAAVAREAGAFAVDHADLSGACAFVVGNEGAGLSPAALELCSGRINIPCKVESLNVAAAASILLFAASQQVTR